MDIDIQYILKVLLRNPVFLISAGLVMICFIKFLAEPEKRKIAIGAVWSTILLIAFVLLWGLGCIVFPAIDEAFDNATGGIFFKTAVTAPTAVTFNNDSESEDTNNSSEDVVSVAEGETSVVEEDERNWGEGTPRGPRGHLTNR